MLTTFPHRLSLTVEDVYNDLFERLANKAPGTNQGAHIDEGRIVASMYGALGSIVNLFDGFGYAPSEGYGGQTIGRSGAAYYSPITNRTYGWDRRDTPYTITNYVLASILQELGKPIHFSRRFADYDTITTLRQCIAQLRYCSCAPRFAGVVESKDSGTWPTEQQARGAWADAQPTVTPQVGVAIEWSAYFWRTSDNQPHYRISSANNAAFYMPWRVPWRSLGTITFPFTLPTHILGGATLTTPDASYPITSNSVTVSNLSGVGLDEFGLSFDDLPSRITFGQSERLSMNQLSASNFEVYE